jgi:hypothetical protein
MPKNVEDWQGIHVIKTKCAFFQRMENVEMQTNREIADQSHAIV